MMTRYIKYIFLTLTAVLLAVSCLEEMESPQPMPQEEALTLVPRVHNFANQYVTKAAYNSDEHVISSVSVLIFNSEGTLLEILESASTKVNVNKTYLSRHGSLVDAKIVMFANIDLADVKNSSGSIIDNKDNLKYTALADYTCHLNPNKVVITDLSISGGFTGFPMIGETTADLSPTATQQAAIEVPLKILYAKVNFEIAVEQSTENQTIVSGGSTFSLTGYTVNNVATSTKYGALAEGAATPEGTTYKTDAVSGIATGSVNLSSTTPLKFTFYMAESCYNHNLASLNGIYPSDEWLTSTENNDVKNYTSLTDEQKALPQNKLNGVKYAYDDLIQQYKPKLANVDGAAPDKGLATYVTVKGTYTDYRGTPWTVNYKIYLGKDNAQDFHVDRNSEYTNILTIKGIRNNDDHTGTDVWIDHRVDVSTTDISGNVTITRETLIDSHIEVRPLRVKWEGNTYSGVRVYLPTDDSNGELLDWIGMERFTGENCLDGSTYCYVNGVATGKRKYFTTSLISELQSKTGEFGVQLDNGKKFIYLLNGECVWIYFDENTKSSERPADIKLQFYDKDGKPIGDPEVYQVKQRGLQTVGGYAIESYEEYLHTYDSVDKYNLSTNPADYTQEGFQWGLSGIELSGNSIVCPFELNPLSIPYIGDLVDPKDYIPEGPRYDYFLQSDGEYNLYTKVNGSWATASFGTGIDFTKQAGEKALIKVIDMGSAPESAYQYCLSKNKFEVNADGTAVEMKIKWYLPDSHELQSVFNSVDANVNDFVLDGFYWSSQPSSVDFGLSDLPVVGSYLTGYSIKDEDQSKARAVSKTQISDTDRTKPNRIRCFYDSVGEETNMAGRIPEGVGGNYTFYMTAYRNKSKATHGYLDFLLELEEAQPNESSPDGEYGCLDDEYPYPTEDNLGEFSKYYFSTVAKDGSTVTGLTIDPVNNSDYWTEYEVNFDLGLVNYAYPTGYYTTLATYPGLSWYTTTKIGKSVLDALIPSSILDRIDVNQYLADAYLPTTTPKTDTKTVGLTKTILFNKTINADITLPNLQNMLNMALDKGNNSRWPIFEYDELYSSNERVYTRYWKLKYPMDKYTEQDLTTTKPYEATETATETATATAVGGGFASESRANSASLEQATEVAQKAAYDAAVQKANAAFPTAALSFGSPTYQMVGNPTYKPKKSWGTWKSECTVTYKCTIQVTIVLAGNDVWYYRFPEGSPWADEVYKDSDPVEGQVNTDKFAMYCGNTFTISVTDSNYEITKVKVYTGDNLVKKTGVQYVGEDKYYARFVESGIDLTGKSQNINKIAGGEVTLQLEGMEYISENGQIVHQWSGSGKQTVTFKLADYAILDNFTSASYTYKYEEANADLSKSIVIDRIEVKCTKKATAASE